MRQCGTWSEIKQKVFFITSVINRLKGDIKDDGLLVVVGVGNIGDLPAHCIIGCKNCQTRD